MPLAVWGVLIVMGLDVGLSIHSLQTWGGWGGEGVVVGTMEGERVVTIERQNCQKGGSLDGMLRCVDGSIVNSSR